MAVKLIKHTGECDHPDEPELPFKLELVMRPPNLMPIAWAFLHGGVEEVVVRGEAADEIRAWMVLHGLSDHVRLSRWRITGPEGTVEEFNWK